MYTLCTKVLAGVALAEAVVIAILASIAMNAQTPSDEPHSTLDECLRKTTRVPDTTGLVFGREGGICVDYHRDPLATHTLSPCPTPGALRVEHGINIQYTNIALKYVRPDHLCLVDTETSQPYICAPREPYTNTYKNWTIGTPGCPERWFINGRVGVCLKPALRRPAHWLNEVYMTAEPARTTEAEATCSPTGIVLSRENMDGYMGSRFFTLHREDGIMRHAVIADKNFYVIGNPTRSAIQKAINEHELRDPRTDTVVLPNSIVVTNTRYLTQFNCRHIEPTIEVAP